MSMDILINVILIWSDKLANSLSLLPEFEYNMLARKDSQSRLPANNALLALVFNGLNLPDPSVMALLPP